MLEACLGGQVASPWKVVFFGLLSKQVRRGFLHSTSFPQDSLLIAGHWAEHQRSEMNRILSLPREVWRPRRMRSKCLQ